MLMSPAGFQPGVGVRAVESAKARLLVIENHQLLHRLERDGVEISLG